MSVDKIFEALSSAPHRRIPAGYLQAFIGAGNKRGQNVHYGLEEDALTGTLVHFLAEVWPRSRPFHKDSAEVAKRKRERKIEA
jgi:ArsR family transcriptional regulator, arsenate/arsenite/antimonite-responsive transcriptional repressor